MNSKRKRMSSIERKRDKISKEVDLGKRRIKMICSQKLSTVITRR